MPSTKMNSTPSQKNEEKAKKPAPVMRETLESFCVALILAFLFRAFVAEAFVIPTGSMAPTLMGAHKDVNCSECGFGYQSNASLEVDEMGAPKNDVVVATTCPLCRFTMPMDLRNNANHDTFSGDRILVSKSSYLVHKPNRWDVIVFKFPAQARINYIKRLIGRPNEIIRVQHGDIYIRESKSEQFVIARKPPNVIGSMLQPLYDSHYLPKRFLAAGMPNAWQPVSKADTVSIKNTAASAWTIHQDAQKWEAVFDSSLAPNNDVSWLRYHHRVIDSPVWDYLIKNNRLPAAIEPTSSRLISDFTGYNASLPVPREKVYQKVPAQDLWRNLHIPILSNDKQVIREEYSGTHPSDNFQHLKELEHRNQGQNPNVGNDGLHWVGDLAVEIQINIKSSSGIVVLDLVEAGVHHQCSIDVSTGIATLKLVDNGHEVSAMETGEGSYVAQSTSKVGVQGPGNYRLRLANVDDSLVLWVNGSSQTFSPSNRFEATKLRGNSLPKPKSSALDSLDYAPVGIGLSGLNATVSRTQVWRDVYYIATNGTSEFTDYDNFREILSKVSSFDERQYLNRSGIDPATTPTRSQDYPLARNVVYTTPTMWENSELFSRRKTQEFHLGDNEYFPMGDNSPQSSDGRVWGFALPEKLLIGRAVLVFWPHAWNRPIPLLPNVRRMGLIR